MIVVTGAGRTGTSLVMQTLRLLGVPVVGVEFHSLAPRDFNPKGYWELSPDQTAQEALKAHEGMDSAGAAIKLPGEMLLGCDPDDVSALIHCKRNRNFAVKSMVPLLQRYGELLGVKPTRATAEAVYDAHEAAIKRWRDAYPEVPCIEVRHEEFRIYPERVIGHIVRFLDIAGDVGYAAAVANVDTYPVYMRSTIEAVFAS